MRVEVVPQLGAHELVGVDGQDPVTAGMVDGELAGWLGDPMLSTRESEDAAAMPLGDGERRIRALHVADDELVEVRDRLEHAL